MLKIGIFTFHAHHNYGAMLQTFATQYTLKKFGYNAEVVNVYSKKLEKENFFRKKPTSIKSFLQYIYALLDLKSQKKAQLFEQFHNSLPLSKRYYDYDTLYKDYPQYDIYLVGSDQVWNIEYGLKERNFFFLDFLPSSAKKISYAPSFGNYNVPKEYYPRLNSLLSSFRYISVRESAGVPLLKDITGRECVQTLDSTFLLDGEEWAKISDDSPLIEGNYILYYGFDKNPKNQEILNKLKKDLQMPIVGISVSLTIPYKIDRFYKAVGPREYINLFRYASYVVTSSFHGVAFAIHFRKDFLVLTTGTRMSRMESLLRLFELEDRIVHSIDDYNKFPSSVNYSQIEELIQNERQRSFKWLQQSLKSLENE